MADDEFRVGDLRVVLDGCEIVLFHGLKHVSSTMLTCPDDAENAFGILKWVLVVYPKMWGDK